MNDPIILSSTILDLWLAASSTIIYRLFLSATDHSKIQTAK